MYTKFNKYCCVRANKRDAFANFGALNKLSCIKQNTNLKTGKNTSTYSISGISGKREREREREILV